ncbi:MAG: cbb3-type cytochrome c oxidase N-terminal domain-containing protein [Thermoanaerobaculales bacterium]|jgi:cytochrome c oxidase cbb3-type subunit 3|nr:cbb3-type cytochrome c oxidase N-terminal domain-containing protein [Thermoanaerobaculales bacterium]
MSHEAPTDDHLLEHSYDGIQEYDNPLPRWWLAIFWLCIAFAPLYVLFFHFGPGLLAHERYDRAMMIATEKQMAAILAMGEINEPLLVNLMDDPSMVNGGKKVFAAKCATCHGVFGEGGIGPNLTDDHWLHGAQLMDIYRTVREGVPDKGMLAWERQLRPAELLAVSAHVGTLLGSDPPNAKDPQGDQVERTVPEPVVEEEGETAEGGA